jgi:hypothetical protein
MGVGILLGKIPNPQIPKPKSQVLRLGFLGIWNLGFGIWDLSEGQSESELYRPRRVCEVELYSGSP